MVSGSNLRRPFLPTSTCLSAETGRMVSESERAKKKVVRRARLRYMDDGRRFVRRGSGKRRG